MKFHRRLLLIPLCFLAACSQTLVATRGLSVDETLLAAMGSIPIGVEVEGLTSQGRDAAGFQYLLGILPFGRVVIDDLDLAVERALYRELSRQGYRPVLAPHRASRTLRVKIRDYNLSAFDLIAARRVRARISAVVSLIDERGTAYELPVSVSESSFERYGFAPELRKVLERALSSFATTALHQVDAIRHHRSSNQL